MNYSDKKVNDRKSMIMFISSMLIFGTIGIFRRYIPLPSDFLACSRGILGGLFLLAFITVTKKDVGDRIKTGDFIGLVITGALMGVNWILLFEAYNYTTVAVATLCYYMQPTIVVLLSPIIFKEALTRKKTLCAAIAIIGMVLVSGVIGDSGAQSGNIKGILLGLGAAVFYSSVVIMNNKIQGIDAYKKTTIQLLSAGIVMIPYLLVTGGFTSEGFSLTAVLLLLVVGIVHTGIAYVFYFGSMDGLNVQSIAIFSYIDPVSALFFSAFLLGERLSVLSIIGAVMIIGSALVSEIQTDTEN